MSLLVAKEVFFSVLSSLEFASKAGFRRVDTIADSDNDFIVQCRWYISYFWCQMFLFLSRKACKIKNNCIMVVYSTMGYFEVRDGPEEATVHSPWWEAKTQCIMREALFRNLFLTANAMYHHHHCSIPYFTFFAKMHVCLWFLPSDILRDLPLRRTTKNKGSAVSSVATAMSGIISHPVTGVGASIKHEIWMKTTTTMTKCICGTLENKI